jgi:hypothetical protein
MSLTDQVGGVDVAIVLAAESACPRAGGTPCLRRVAGWSSVSLPAGTTGMTMSDFPEPSSRAIRRDRLLGSTATRADLAEVIPAARCGRTKVLYEDAQPLDELNKSIRRCARQPGSPARLVAVIP